MPQETRSRITLLLPAPISAAHFILLNDIITEVVRFCGGATVSQQSPAVFDGWWMPGHDSPPDYDAVVLIQGDALVRPGLTALLEYLDYLKARAQHIFHQDIVWITVHDVTRVTTGDFVR